MAKKVVTKTKTKVAKAKVDAKGFEHLEGLHDYTSCVNKKEFSDYVSKAMEQVRDSEYIPEAIKLQMEDLESAFEKLSDKPKDVEQCRIISGQIISQLHYYHKPE